MLSTILPILVGFIISNQESFDKINQAFYQDYQEIEIAYHPDFDRNQLIQEISALKSGTIVSQYTFVVEKELIIFTNDLTIKERIPKTNLKIQVKPFAKVGEVGLGDKFFIKKAREDVEEIFVKYGTILSHDTLQGVCVYRQNTALFLSLIYLVFLFFLMMSLTLIRMRKEILLKKLHGYPFFEVLKSTIGIEKISVVIYMLSSLLSLGMVFFNNLPLTNFVIFLMAIDLIFFILFSILLMILYRFLNFNTYKNKRFEKSMTYCLCAGLLILTSLSLSQINSSFKDMSSLYEKFKTLSKLSQTKNIYHFGSSKSTNRDDMATELIFEEKSRAFYKSLSQTENTFVIQALRYAQKGDFNPLTHKANKGVLYSGEWVAKYSDNLNYYTNPAGNSLLVDSRYLKRNLIKIKDKDFFSRDFNGNIIYLLVPEKYRSLHDEIIKDYEKSAENELDFIPGSKFEIVYTENNQEYFTYTIDKGDPALGHSVVDPIAIVMNDNLISGNTFGNLLAEGLFYENEESNLKKVYQTIKPSVEKAGFENEITYVSAVYYRYLNKYKDSLVYVINQVLRLAILLLFEVILLKQITYYFVKSKAKQLYLKYTLGYALSDRLLDGLFIPSVILLVATIYANFLAYSWLSISLALVLLFIAFFDCFQMQKKLIKKRGNLS
jgi:hypothetical protein